MLCDADKDALAVGATAIARDALKLGEGLGDTLTAAPHTALLPAGYALTQAAVVNLSRARQSMQREQPGE